MYSFTSSLFYFPQVTSLKREYKTETLILACLKMSHYASKSLDSLGNSRFKRISPQNFEDIA